MNIELLVSIILFTVAIFLFSLLHGQNHAIRTLRKELFHLRGKVHKRWLRRIQIQEGQSLFEKGFDIGTVLVESVHKTISGITFKTVRQNTDSREETEAIQKMHDISVSRAYDKIRSVNQLIGDITSIIIQPKRPYHPLRKKISGGNA